MNIISHRVLDAALRYVVAGMSVLPCKGKQPNISRWEQLQHTRPTAADVRRWHNAGVLQNVGIIGGKVSGNLVIIDLDGLNAVESFESNFPQLAKSLSVASGSGVGRHVYLRVTGHMPLNFRRKSKAWGCVEVRGNGCYVVAPPSIHPDSGQPYRWLKGDGVLEVNDIDDVIDFYAADADDMAAATPPASPLPRRRAGGWRSFTEIYLESALEREVARVQQAPPGERNNSLFWAAAHMGNFLHTGLDRSDVEARLLGAALSVGTPGAEAQRTIKSGLNIGMKYPKSLPQQRKA
jgi:hypothetical protein